MHRRQAGAAAVEFHIVAMFAMLPMLLGLLQLALLLAANHQVDLAAFLAARAGATEGGSHVVMRAAFADALVPMFVAAGSGEGNDGAGGLATRVLAARARAAADVALYGRLRVLSPTSDSAREVAVERNGRRVIPNDSLPFRLRRPDGRALLEASLLEIEATWCHPLVVPIARPLLVSAMRRLDGEPWHQRCYAGDRLPIRSRSVVPMQSDFIVDQ